MADPYLLPGTDVLRNRCGITDAATLADFELKVSLARVAGLELRPVAGDFDLQHLCAIHGHIFGDVYDWAGAIRTVNIAKGMFFCRFDWIEDQARRVFGEIADDTRTQRVFFQQLAWVAGWPIDWTRVDYAAFIRARHENLCTAKVDALVEVLEPAVEAP